MMLWAYEGFRGMFEGPHQATSIPAAEHSTITSWTKPGEVEAFKNDKAKLSRACTGTHLGLQWHVNTRRAYEDLFDHEADRQLEDWYATYYQNYSSGDEAASDSS